MIHKATSAAPSSATAATVAKTRSAPPPSKPAAKPSKPSIFAGFSLASLLPGPRVKVVQVRHKDLKPLPTGRERALAYENAHHRGFWFFGGPVDFKEPTLPEAGSELDGSLLPPRIP